MFFNSKVCVTAEIEEMFAIKERKFYMQIDSIEQENKYIFFIIFF